MKLHDASIGAIFALPDTTWQLLTYRVGGMLVALEAGIDRQLHGLVPELPQLAGQCEAWHGYTFGALTRYAGMVARFAGQAADEFAVLQHTVGHLDRAAPLPPPHAQVIRNTLAALDRPARQVAATAATLGLHIEAFWAANRPLSAAVRRWQGELRRLPQFDTCLPLLAHLDEACADGACLGAAAWHEIADGLAAVVDGSTHLDWRILAGPEIASAIAQWRQLRDQAARFAARADELACPAFLSGDWITASMPAPAVFTATDPLGRLGQFLMLTTGRTPPYPLPVEQTVQHSPLDVAIG